jgi:hypothetical protein
MFEESREGNDADARAYDLAWCFTMIGLVLPHRWHRRGMLPRNVSRLVPLRHQQRPRQIAYAPTPRAGCPQVRVTLSLGLGDSAGAPIPVDFHGGRSLHKGRRRDTRPPRGKEHAAATLSLPARTTEAFASGADLDRQHGGTAMLAVRPSAAYQRRARPLRLGDEPRNRALG